MSTNPELVTIDRVIASAAELGFSLEDDLSGRAAHAHVSGFDVLVVLLDTVLIVRADAATDLPSDTTDAILYFAANQVNSTLVDARALVVNRTDTLVVRTESETTVAAGLTDAQLQSALKVAFDAVMQAQDAMVAVTETLGESTEE